MEIFNILEEEILNKFPCKKIEKKILRELTEEVSRISMNIVFEKYTSPHEAKLEFAELINKYYQETKSDEAKVELLEYSCALAKYLNNLLKGYPVSYII
jgi:16S rRNA C1402 N4-methylase RsmH